MKKIRIIAFILALLLFLLPFSGCAQIHKTPEPIEGPKLADLKETDSPVIYTYTGSGNHTAFDQRRINQFTALYDVDVEIVCVDGYIPEYTERIINDLASGSGPDVLFLDQLYSSDIAKVALNGNFLNLTDILAEDPDFSEEDYVAGVFEAGRFGGRQYLIPLSYELPLMMSSEEKLAELGFDWDKIDTTADFAETIALLTPDAKQTIGFRQMLDSKNRFSQLLITSGVSLSDYEAGEILPDEKGLREFLEAYKAYFPYDYDGSGRTYITNACYQELISEQWVFWLAPDIYGLAKEMSAMKDESCEYTLHSIPGQTGETVGNIRSGAMAIRSNTENSLNAYHFIKFMLSEDAQRDRDINQRCIPIHKEAIRESVYEAPSVKIVGNYEVLDYEEPAFSDEEAEMLIEMLTDVDRFVLGLPFMSNIVQETMLPFFKDEKSYDDCLADLKNQLTFYLSE